jgi:hypothetical protein
MNLRPADPELKPLQEAEVIEILNQPIYLRVAMINAHDGTPLVPPYMVQLQRWKVLCR